MIINKAINGTALTLLLEGRLDTATSPELEAVLKESLDGVKELCFDFENLTYISSSGLRVLLYARKTMSKQGDVKLTGVSAPIMEIFDVTGFSDFFTIICK